MGLFSAAKSGNDLLIKVPNPFDITAADMFPRYAKDWLASGAKQFVFDYTSVTQLDPAAYKAIILFFRQVKAKGATLKSMNMSRDIRMQIIEVGLDTVFGLISSVAPTPVKSALDVNFVNPFIKSTQITLQTQAGVEARIGKPFLKGAQQQTPTVVMGVLSLVSKVFQGSIALCFPATLFLVVCSKLFEEKQPTITGENAEVTGELLNLIFAQAKRMLNEKEGYQIQKAIPTVIHGSAIAIRHMSKDAAVVLPFDTDAGPLYLEISLESYASP